ENCVMVASQYSRAASGIGFSAPTRPPRSGSGVRVAYVCSQLCDDDSATRMPMGVVKAADPKKSKFFVYSTEAYVRRDRQQFMQSSYVSASSKRGREAMESLSRCGATVWTAPLDGDAVSAARELAAQICRDQIDVVVFDCTQADAVANLVACWDL